MRVADQCQAFVAAILAALRLGDAQVAAIAASMKEWGWTTPALVGEAAISDSAARAAVNARSGCGNRGAAGKLPEAELGDACGNEREACCRER